MRFTLMHLINSPTAYAKLKAEIDGAAGTVPAPPAVIPDAAARELPYLQAVIREGLRLWPPGNGLAPKLVPAGGETLCGLFLPAGTNMGQNMYGIARLKSFWGDDADAFLPERWLGVEPERLKEMQGVVDLVVGHGKFLCLGKTIALMELNKVFVEVSFSAVWPAVPLKTVSCLNLTKLQLLRRYDFGIVHPLKPCAIRSASVWVTSEFWLRITRREIPS